MLKNIGFEFPVFLTFIHYIVAYLLMALLKSFSLLPAAPPSSKSSSLSLYTLGIVMSLSTGLANVSLKYNRFLKISLSLYLLWVFIYNSVSYRFSPQFFVPCLCFPVLDSTRWRKSLLRLLLCLQSSCGIEREFLS